MVQRAKGVVRGAKAERVIERARALGLPPDEHVAAIQGSAEAQRHTYRVPRKDARSLAPEQRAAGAGRPRTRPQIEYVPRATPLHGAKSLLVLGDSSRDLQG